MQSGTGFKSFIVKERFEILREIVLSIIVSAFVSSYITYYYNQKMDQRISDRQFIYEFSRTFIDNPKYRNVSIALEDQYLYGKEEKLSTISNYDLDDYLGLLADMWTYYSYGYISRDMLSDQYYYYYCITYNSKFVNDYRKQLKNGGVEDNWIFLDDVADQLELKNVNCKT